MAFNPVAAVENWARAYVGNASSVRDFRSQLRGNRSLWLWGSYLVILILVTSVVYSTTASGNARSIVQIQNQLREFYQVVMAMLGALVCLVTPAMTATAVVAERQRKSLDLVFSAPVLPSYYLLGKMLSSFRYTWMLLILSIPIVSVAIVMGGATWGDVLASYLMLSMIGLVFSAIGLLISTLGTSLVSSIIYSYIAIGGYNALTGILYGASMASSSMRMGTGSSQEMGFGAGMNPFTVWMAAPTYSTWGRYEIPNWIIVSLVCLITTKIVVMAAASMLSYYKSRDTIVFRVWALGFIALVFGLIIGPLSLPSFAGTGTSHVLGLLGGYIVAMSAFFVMPHLMAYGKDAERRYWFDGDFNLKAAFLGTPAGALPYALMQWLAAFGGAGLSVYLLQASIPNEYFFHAAFWSLGYIFMWWCVGRWASELARGLRAARVGVFMSILVVVALPVPLLSIIQMNTYSTSTTHWTVYLLYPLSTEENMKLAWVYALLMGAIGTVLYLIAVSRRKLRTTTAPPRPPGPPERPTFEV